MVVVVVVQRGVSRAILIARGTTVSSQRGTQVSDG